MLGWLKRLIKGWLLDDEKDTENDDFWLDCVVYNKGVPDKKRYYIVGSAGLNLVGKPLGEEGERQALIRQQEAEDIDKFWSLWRKFNPDVSFEWEESEEDKCRKT
jgi:hypothetical protein